MHPTTTTTAATATARAVDEWAKEKKKPKMTTEASLLMPPRNFNRAVILSFCLPVLLTLAACLLWPTIYDPNQCLKLSNNSSDDYDLAQQRLMRIEKKLARERGSCKLRRTVLFFWAGVLSLTLKDKVIQRRRTESTLHTHTLSHLLNHTRRKFR